MYKVIYKPTDCIKSNKYRISVQGKIAYTLVDFFVSSCIIAKLPFFKGKRGVLFSGVHQIVRFGR